MNEKEIEGKNGERSTFIIQVQFRQNATWQGTISWTNQKKTQHFRSTLEMIKLMDDAINERSGEEQFAQWGGSEK